MFVLVRLYIKLIRLYMYVFLVIFFSVRGRLVCVKVLLWLLGPKCVTVFRTKRRDKKVSELGKFM